MAKTRTPAGAAKSRAGGKKAAEPVDLSFGSRPRDDDERADMRATGTLRRGEQTQALEPGQHPDRTHESNLVEVSEMKFTRIVDGHRYGPFNADAPAEKRRVPVSLQVSLNLPLAGKKASASKKAETIDTGTGGQRLAGHERPPADPDRALVTEEEKEAAAEAAGRSQDDQLAKREARLGLTEE